MPPENLRLYAERLATLEAQHRAMEDKHIMSIDSLTERLEAHIEETDRQFATVNASVTSTQNSVDVLAKTVGDFITLHNAMDNNKKEKKIELWQWLAIIGAFAGPSIFEKLLKILGF